MMKNAVRILNIALGAFIFFAVALLARELIVWKYGWKYWPGASLTPLRPSGATEPPKEADFTSYASIGDSGVFGAGKLSLIETRPASAASEGQVALIGTSVGWPDGYAVFFDRGAGKQGVFRRGEDVFGIGVLKHIERQQVVIDSSGRALTLQMPFKDRLPSIEAAS